MIDLQLRSAAPAQVLLRWAVQQGLAIIPKSNSHERLVQNLQVESFELSEADIKALSSLNINLRVSTGSSVQHGNESY